jgi:hypothetical protein
MNNEHIEAIKKQYPKAYQKWTSSEETLLLEEYQNGVSLIQLAKEFERQPSAISGRLFRLRFGENSNVDLRQGIIEFKMAFEWEVVLSSDQDEYIFPNSITAYMKQKYRKPVIYRWIIDRGQGERCYYIGEAIRFCPDRLSSYLFPGPSQQTNIRLNRIFQEGIKNGASLRLEILRMSGAFVNDLDLEEKDLARQDIRRLIEKLLVTLYRNQGLDLLNL